jgi:hypothetical protein
MKMRIATTICAALLLAGGCSKKTDGEVQAVETAPAANDSPGDAAAQAPRAAMPPEVAGVRGLAPLTQAGVYPIVRNNAINALKAWDAKNYLDALVSLRTIMSLPEAAPYSALLEGAFAEMLAALKPAANAGNQSARDALEYAQSTLTNQ